MPEHVENVGAHEILKMIREGALKGKESITITMHDGEADPSLDRGQWEGVPDPVFLLVQRTVRYRWGLEETPHKVFLSRKEAEEYGDHEYGKETHVPYSYPSPAGNTWSVLLLSAHGALATLLKEHAWSKDRVVTGGKI